MNNLKGQEGISTSTWWTQEYSAPACRG
uniref:Uncharacterized protein n=1 Tax=Arundo donax TaxID=35708 RepID=A0A0A9E3R8_ARUDO